MVWYGMVEVCPGRLRVVLWRGSQFLFFVIIIIIKIECNVAEKVTMVRAAFGLGVG